MKSLLASAAVLALASASHAELIYGLTDTGGSGGTGAGAGLVTFDSATPGTLSSVVPITGAVNLRGIDFRPATGQLYGIGYTTAGTAAQLYTINTTTGVASTVGGPVSIPSLGASTRISIDFNPVVDRLRVVSGAGGNVRLNPNDGTVAGTDTTLAYAAGQSLTGTPLIGGVAYTNNVAGATSTTLYAYDFTNDFISTIGSVNGTPTSPNTGQLFTVGSILPPSGGDAGNGFDISGATGIAYLTFDDFNSPGFGTEFYTVNLATGGLTQVGGNEVFGIDLLDISVSPVIPEPTSLAALGLGSLLLKRRRA